jgi:transketolase
MPCWELFTQQTPEYQEEVLGRAPRIGIEAAARLGWDRWLGRDGVFIGMSGFGASAPAEDLYKHFNITAAAVVAAARSLLAA